MLKLIDYVLDSDEKPTIPQYNYLESFNEDFDVLLHFQNSLSQEKEVTNVVSKIVYAARKAEDITTYNFMQWFVSEQREEETKFKDIIDKLKMVGESGLAIYEIDKELGSLPNETAEI